MKVYVVYSLYEWEGCGAPSKAFDSKEKAEAHIQVLYAEELGCEYAYEELELE